MRGCVCLYVRGNCSFDSLWFPLQVRLGFLFRWPGRSFLLSVVAFPSSAVSAKCSQSVGLGGLRCIRVMAKFLRVGYVFIAWLAAGCASANAFLPPGLKSGLYGDAVSHSDFQLNIKPPEEAHQDVEASLDALLKLEESKRKASAEQFVLEKQRMISAERQQLREIVENAFEGLRA